MARKEEEAVQAEFVIKGGKMVLPEKKVEEEPYNPRAGWEKIGYPYEKPKDAPPAEPSKHWSD